MFSMYISFILVAVFSTVGSIPAPNASAGPPTDLGPSQLLQPPTEAFPYNHTLDDNGEYILYWKFNDSHITFEVHVKTRGYVGFGISPNGKMYPADIVIGWVKDGQAYLTDRHAVGHFEPILDKSQDWILLHGEENHFGTVLKFVRKLDTCDGDDRKITDDTLRIIYSYHPDDPHSDNGIPYHGATTRGARSLLLLSQPKAPAVMPDDVKTFDFLNRNYSVPSADTTYHCTVFKFPQLQAKHHLIKYEPIVQAGNEMHVHHMVIYQCQTNGSNLDHFDGDSYTCYDRQEQPVDLRSRCQFTYLAWAIGAGVSYFPEDVGLSLGTLDDPTVFVMETHYNNPTFRDDIVDNSGIRITFTPTLRRHDAGMLIVGSSVSPLQVIPPHEEAFVSKTGCAEHCLSQGLTDQPEGIKAFAVLHHMHLLGSAMKTRLVRNGVELEPIAIDDSYDFDYQETRFMRQEYTILPGDTILVDCVYNSMDATNATYGGLSTSEEMCISFIMYYPRMPLTTCLSKPLYDNAYPGAKDWMIKPTLADYNWTDSASRARFVDIVDESKLKYACIQKSAQSLYYTEDGYYPEINQTYVAPPTSCPLPTTSQGARLPNFRNTLHLLLYVFTLQIYLI